MKKHRMNVLIGFCSVIILGVFMVCSPKTLPLTSREVKWAQKIEVAPDGSFVINRDRTIFAKVLTRVGSDTSLQYIGIEGFSGQGLVGTKSLTNVEWIIPPDNINYSVYQKEYNHLILQKKRG